MKRIQFLNKEKMLEAEHILSSHLSEWVKKWTVGQSFHVGLFKFDTEAELYKSVNGDQVLTSAEVSLIDNFYWDDLIFGAYKAACPRDEKFTEAIELVRDSFLKSAVGFDLIDQKSEKLGSYRDRINIIFQFGEIGCLVIECRESDLLGLFSKIPKRKPNKPLASKLSAINDIKINASIMLDLGSLGFSDILGVKPGAIIKTNKNVGNEFDLNIKNNPVVRVNMGKCKSNKAIIMRGVV